MKEFKAFLMRGNMVELAVAVVLGAAFGAVVTSLVKDVLTPLLGLLQVPDFSEAGMDVGSARIRYGLFLNALITFIAVAASVFFLVVKPVNRLMDRMTKPKPGSPTRECPHCMSMIPGSATVCASCTRDVDTQPAG